jgi:hypothetical protein
MAKWFYFVDGQQAGPVESAVLKQLAMSGGLKPTDKVRREDLAGCYEAKQVKGLFSNDQPRSVPASSSSPNSKANEVQNSATHSRILAPPKLPTSSAASGNAPAARTIRNATPLPHTSTPVEADRVPTRNRVLNKMIIALGVASCGIVGFLLVTMTGATRSPAVPDTAAAAADESKTIPKAAIGDSANAANTAQPTATSTRDSQPPLSVTPEKEASPLTCFTDQEGHVPQATGSIGKFTFGATKEAVKKIIHQNGQTCDDRRCPARS